MDSFYEQPRKPPVFKNNLIRPEQMISSMVPDVSMLMQSNGNLPTRMPEMSYNAWKRQHKTSQPTIENKENINDFMNQQQQPSILRKQVRFESPQTLRNSNMHKILPNKADIVSTCTNDILKTTNFNRMEQPPDSPISRRHIVQSSSDHILEKHTNNNLKQNRLPEFQKKCSQNMADSFALPNFTQRYNSSQPLKNQPVNSLEQVYMANIPNRCLDLSIIESHQSAQQNSVASNRSVGQHNLVTESTNIEQKSAIVDEEPTVKDLLKIIQQQNQQLITLQQQVTSLIQERNQQDVAAAAPLTVFKNKQLEPKNGMPKFSIDVMTSFEVSLRGPSKYNNRGFARDFVGSEGKIQEITESRASDVSSKTDTRAVDESLTLNEPLEVQERCLSPTNSIHVDMQDFSSDSETEDEAVNKSLIGWTIYNNVMGQVNCLLKNVRDTDSEPKLKFGGGTMKRVKEVTLKHLKSVGVDLPNVSEENSLTSSNGEVQYTPSDISFAVKQLLMKYLPDEHLAEIATQRESPVPKNYPKNMIKRRPEFSLATVQYMEKYNLLNKGPTSFATKKVQPQGKMLDITALKQQSKLL